MMNDEKGIVGVDLGGTKIRAAVTARNGSLMGPAVERPTGNRKSRKTVEAALMRSIQDAVGQSGIAMEQVEAIGIGAPGPLDLSTGTILKAPNLPGLHHYPLRRRVEERFRVPVRVDNDGNCFTLGEALYGSGRSKGIVLGVTLGTGVGCGVVIGGRVFHGATGTAGEIWATPYGRSTIEEWFSARGVSGLHQRRTGESRGARQLFQSAESGDREALKTWDRFGYHLGRALAALVNLLDPDLIALGGSVSRAHAFFLPAMDKNLRKIINPAPAQYLQILPALLKEGAVQGAAALCRSRA